jgi:hypothetical protein
MHFQIWYTWVCGNNRSWHSDNGDKREQSAMSLFGGLSAPRAKIGTRNVPGSSEQAVVFFRRIMQGTQTVSRVLHTLSLSVRRTFSTDIRARKHEPGIDYERKSKGRMMGTRDERRPTYTPICGRTLSSKKYGPMQLLIEVHLYKKSITGQYQKVKSL